MGERWGSPKTSGCVAAPPFFTPLPHTWGRGRPSQVRRPGGGLLLPTPERETVGSRFFLAARASPAYTYSRPAPAHAPPMFPRLRRRAARTLRRTLRPAVAALLVLAQCVAAFGAPVFVPRGGSV